MSAVRGAVQVARGEPTREQLAEHHRAGTCAGCRRSVLLHPMTVAWRNRIVRDGLIPPPLRCEVCLPGAERRTSEDRMKRTPLVRKTPLTSRPAQGLPPSKLLRRAQLRRQSPKRAREQRQRSKIAKQLERDHGRPLCQIHWDDRCTGLADDWDERKSRAAGGSITDLANAQMTCRPCHDAKHANPAEAERRGYTISARSIPEPEEPR